MEKTSVEDDKNATSDHHDVPQPSTPEDLAMVKPDKGAINLLLICSCLAFGAASFLFGYDDKVISPVAATQYFVRSISFYSHLSFKLEQNPANPAPK